MAERVFKPLILETKEQMIAALRQGKLKYTKYNLLSDNEKLFVEMIVFGDYTAEQAMRAINPSIKNASSAANRLMANKDVADTLEELSVQKDKKFMAELSSARDMALSKLKYIMGTTTDDAIAAACAKTILDKAEKIILDTARSNAADNAVTDIKFAIQVDNYVVNPRTEAKDYNPNRDVEIEITKDDVGEESKQEVFPEDTTPNEFGTNFILSYEGIDNYNVPVEPDTEDKE